MRKTLIALTAAAALAGSAVSPALANQWQHRHHQNNAWVAPATGVATGTVVGVGLSQGWWGGSTLATTFGSTTGGAFAGGILAGAGTIALIHAVTTPCTGFHALFGGSGCVNGQYVGG